MWIVVLCAGAYLFIRIALWAYRWTNPRSSGQLPPGSMGYPLIGETLQYFAAGTGTTLQVSPFVRERVKRYGQVFKTSLLGQPAVMLTDPELAHFVFQQEEKQFQMWYPLSVREIFGRQTMGFTQGLMHKYLKGLTLKLVGPETLKAKLFHDVEDVVCRCLSSWAELPTVDVKEVIETMLFDLIAKELISCDPSETSKNLKDNFSTFKKGLYSFPVNLPGTAYSKCMQGRMRAIRMLKSMLQGRQTSPERRNEGGGDFFDFVIEELKQKDTFLTEDVALDLMFVLLLVSYETTAVALAMAIKFLADHPQALEELTVEHEEIIKRRDNPSSKLTWQEFKSMTFTSQVINETTRLVNVAPVLFRKAIVDVQIKGYTIPAGWSVVVCPQAVHLNPDIYKDPLVFNPWRWKNDAESKMSSKNFMAFGGGMRLCVGAEFSKVQMSVFLHYLVTKYRLRAVKGGKIIRILGLTLVDDFHVQIKTKAH